MYQAWRELKWGGIFTVAAHIAGSEVAILAIFTPGKPISSGGGEGD